MSLYPEQQTMTGTEWERYLRWLGERGWSYPGFRTMAQDIFERKVLGRQEEGRSSALLPLPERGHQGGSARGQLEGPQVPVCAVREDALDSDRIPDEWKVTGPWY